MALFIAGMKHKERGGPQWYMHVTYAILLGHTMGSTRKELGRQEDKTVLLKTKGMEESAFFLL